MTESWVRPHHQSLRAPGPREAGGGSVKLGMDSAELPKRQMSVLPPPIPLTAFLLLE